MKMSNQLSEYVFISSPRSRVIIEEMKPCNPLDHTLKIAPDSKASYYRDSDMVQNENSLLP